MHIFTRIVVFALLLSITIPYLVLSYPDGAGTCDVTVMSSQGHGAPLTSGVGGFSLVLGNGTTSGSYTITVKGPKSIKGLLLYTQDSKGTRTGNFVVPSKFQSKSCSGTGTNSLTHKDSSQKSLPLSFSWSPASDSTTNITAKAIVVVSYSDWYQLSDLAFDSKSGSVDTNAPQDTPSSSSGNDGSGSGSNTGSSENYFQKYSLFIIVIIITTVLYIFGSFMELALKRQQVKARALAKAVGGFGQ